MNSNRFSFVNYLLTVRVCFAFCVLSVPLARASVTSSTTHGSESTSLDSQISSIDLLSGLIATERAGDSGWHPANTQPIDQLPALTDGAGALSGLTGLLNDFPGPGNPSKLLQYDFAGPMDIGHIQILSGNQGKDGRVFSTTVIHYSTDGTNFNMLGYFQSDPSGTLNNGRWGSTLVEIYDNANMALLTGIQSLQFDFYSGDNTGSEMRDPFDGLNPFTGVDDNLSAAFVSPLIYEIDVLGDSSPTVPAPSALVLLGTGLSILGMASHRRQKK